MTNASEPDYQELLGWRISEYQKHQRDWQWYLVAGLVLAVLAGLSIFTPNFLFPGPNYLFLIIIILTAVILILINAMADEVDFAITNEGLVIGDRFYDYDKFKNFCVLFKPREDLKVLYLEFKAPLKPRLQIPLEAADPVSVREMLLSFLHEDLDRTDESNVDFFSKLLKF